MPCKWVNISEIKDIILGVTKSTMVLLCTLFIVMITEENTIETLLVSTQVFFDVHQKNKTSISLD